MCFLKNIKIIILQNNLYSCLFLDDYCWSWGLCLHLRHTPAPSRPWALPPPARGPETLQHRALARRAARVLEHGRCDARRYGERLLSWFCISICNSVYIVLFPCIGLCYFLWQTTSYGGHLSYKTNTLHAPHSLPLVFMRGNYKLDLVYNATWEGQGNIVITFREVIFKEFPIIACYNYWIFIIKSQ